jgi:pimeloyl-ACP methyl ester carboxylesterase
MKKTFLWICLSIVVLYVSGCQSELGVKDSSKEAWLISRIGNPLIGMGMSYRVKNFLTQESLLDEYNKDPDMLLKKLNKKFNATGNQDVLLALVELSYIEGKKKDGIDAMYYYLSCCVYTAAYFQAKQLTPKPTPFSPRFIYVCRFYNYATAEILTVLQKEKYRLTKRHDFPIIQGKINLKPAESKLPLPLNEYEKFLICSNYVPYGFLTAARTFGMGVPLIALSDKEYSIKKAKAIDKNLYGMYDAPSPATVFLRISKKDKHTFDGCLEFYDPYKVSSLMINGKEAPLEVDITTPLGYLTRRGPSYSGFAALANPQNMHISEGLYFMTPYDKDKIPLVIVHGLMSEPRTWVQMLNTLMNNKKIREHYQVWFFAYPTGFPILLSCHKLRTALLKAQKVLDPDKNDPNFSKMVIIGHSMGGLLTRIMVQDSGKEIEKIIFTKPIKDLDVKPETKAMLTKTLVFKTLPFVERVIFMSTPHRGAAMTHWPIMKMAVKFITLPLDIVDKMVDIGDSSDVKEGVVGKKALKNLQGVDGLDPKNKVMRHLVDVPIQAKYHSVIGNEEKADEIGGTDGIVTYRSAHLDGAESEVIIKSGHNVQKTPAGIKEIRRILLEHLEE